MCINQISDGQSLISTNLFWSAVGSALGGFVGGILFFAFRAWLEKRRKKPEQIQIYLPGKATQLAGGGLRVFGDSLGKIVTDNDHLKSLNFEDKVLELNSQWIPSANPVQKYIFYGPYNADLSRKGKYKVEFTITGKDFNKNADHNVKETVILTLDVLRQVSTGLNNAQDIFSNKYLKYNDFIDNKRKKIELYVHSEGTGIWEYRAILPEGIIEALTLLKKYDEKFILYFEKVEVTYLPEFALPW